MRPPRLTVHTYPVPTPADGKHWIWVFATVTAHDVAVIVRDAPLLIVPVYVAVTTFELDNGPKLLPVITTLVVPDVDIVLPDSIARPDTTGLTYDVYPVPLLDDVWPPTDTDHC